MNVVLLESYRLNFAKIDRVVATGGIRTHEFRIRKGFTFRADHKRSELASGQMKIFGVVKNPEIIMIKSERIRPATESV